MLAVAAIGAIVTAPREYPVTAFLLAPLGAAIVFGRRITTVVAMLATVVGGIYAVADDQYHGAALWFRLFFLVAASVTIVALTAVREHREEDLVTEQARLRDRSEQRYRSLVEATAAIVSTIDAEGRFRGRLPAWEAYTGQSWPDYADMGWLTAVHPDDREQFRVEWTSAFASGEFHEAACRLWNAATAEYRYVNARGVPIMENGAVREWIGAITDVHDRAEALLRAASDAQLRTAVLQSLQDGVFVTARDGRIIDVNDAWPRLFGFTRDEVLGTLPPYAWWPDPGALPRQQVAFDGMAAIARGEVDSGEFEVSFRHKDGHFFRVLIAMSAIRDGDRVDLLVGTVKDITVHAAAEARLRVIAGVTERLSSANELSEIGHAALAELLPQLECPHGGFFVLDQEQAALCLVADVGLSPGTMERWSRLPLDLPAPAIDVFHSGETLIIVEQDEFAARYPGLANYVRNLGWHTTVNLPLVKGGAVLGVLFLAFDDTRPLTADDLALLHAIGPILAQALDRAGLFEFQRSVASTLQRAMLSPQPFAHADIVVAARYVPAVAELSVGGDWYDVVPLDEERVAIAVGDIVGRGINAAAVMGQLRSALSAVARTTDSAVEAVARLDRFAHGIEGAKATTLLYGIVDPVAGTLRYTSAGHPPALIVSPNGSARFLDGGRGWPLAVADPDRPRPEAVAELEPGSTILLYTDGLVERRNERLEDGLARLACSAASRRSCRSSSCATSCSTSSSAPATPTTSRWSRSVCSARPPRRSRAASRPPRPSSRTSAGRCGTGWPSRSSPNRSVTTCCSRSAKRAPTRSSTRTRVRRVTRSSSKGSAAASRWCSRCATTACGVRS